jgi:hypothetical protein
VTLADRADAALQALYDRVPDVGCKGLCHQACGPIDGGTRERVRMARAGYPLPTPSERRRVVALHQAGIERAPNCPALTDNKRCAAYEIRPMICRIYGAAEGMRCEHGCTPVDGRPLLKDWEAGELIRAATFLQIGVGL